MRKLCVPTGDYPCRYHRCDPFLPVYGFMVFDNIRLEQAYTLDGFMEIMKEL